MLAKVYLLVACLDFVQREGEWEVMSLNSVAGKTCVWCVAATMAALTLLAATWTVIGSVGHWGHIHQRQNQYQARLHVAPIEGEWKLVGLDILEEKRLGGNGIDRIGHRELILLFVPTGRVGAP